MSEDLDLLQGSWAVTTLEVEGQKMPAAMLANAGTVIKGSRFTSMGMGVVYEGTLKLDPSASPRQLDMEFDAGPEKGNTNRGIYKLGGDTWKICLATRGTVRPSRFASKRGDGFALETLTRGAAPVAAKTKTRKSKRAAPAVSESAPPTEFEGEWRMVSAIMDGQPVEESAVQWVKRVTQGSQTTVYAGPQVMMKFEFTSDSSKSPKTVDYRTIVGPNRKKTQYGIYQFDGGLLKICVSAPGSSRPMQFESVPGDGRTLTIWKRA